MLDRQKLEAILANRFPEAAHGQLAAAANAVMALADEHRTGRAHVPPEHRPFRAPLNGFTTVSVSSGINAPIKRVFEMFTDLEHVADRVSGIVRIAALTPGPFGLGTRWLESRKILGRVDSAEMEVTAFERYRTYKVSHQKGGLQIETVFLFEPDRGGTLVTIEFAIDGAGLPVGFLTPLNWAIAGKVRHVLRNDLADLKSHLEAS